MMERRTQRTLDLTRLLTNPGLVILKDRWISQIPNRKYSNEKELLTKLSNMCPKVTNGSILPRLRSRTMKTQSKDILKPLSYLLIHTKATNHHRATTLKREMLTEHQIDSLIVETRSSHNKQLLINFLQPLSRCIVRLHLLNRRHRRQQVLQL